jgi:hypothetical protein
MNAPFFVPANTRTLLMQLLFAATVLRRFNLPIGVPPLLGILS